MVNLKKDGEVNYLQDDGTLDESLKMDISSDMYKSIRKDFMDNKDLVISVTSALGKSEVTGFRAV